MVSGCFEWMLEISVSHPPQSPNCLHNIHRCGSFYSARRFASAHTLMPRHRFYHRQSKHYPSYVSEKLVNALAGGYTLHFLFFLQHDDLIIARVARIWRKWNSYKAEKRKLPSKISSTFSDPHCQVMGLENLEEGQHLQPFRISSWKNVRSTPE